MILMRSPLFHSLALPDSSPLPGSVADPEEARLHALQDLDLLDTPESESFDRITRMASRLFQAPISAVSLTDRHRQWFKSYVGTQGREIPREGAPCAEVTRSADSLVIPDLLADARFATCLLSQAGIRFYAGAPLITREGYVLGALCVLDRQPRVLATGDLDSLRDFAAMVMAQIELQHDLGRIDPLSGLPNRHQLSEDLQDGARHDPDRPRVMVLVDLAEAQHLTQVINALGTRYVDDLVKVGRGATKGTLGRQTGIYQVGMTSFALLLADEEAEAWPARVEALSTQLQKPLWCAGVPVSIQAVFGVFPFRLRDTLPQEVLRRAWSAAYDAREAEIAYAVYNPAHDEAKRRRFALLTDLPTALEQAGQLTLVYQPRVEVRTGVCVSAEALLRWQNPQLGSVSPGEFIPLVEQTALARPVTQWVMATALAQLAQWRQRGWDLRVSINISARNLEEPDFAQTLAQALRTYQVPTSSIELEFTESALIRNRARVLAQLEEIRASGVELAIDDFGTGYSTFAYLHKLPATTLKIDQSFIRTLLTSPKDQVLVRSMIAMAHDIGYRVVAEGVETAEIYRFLAAAGCDEVQGYYLARPLLPGDLETWVREGRDRQISTGLSWLEQSTRTHDHAAETTHGVAPW